MCLLITYTRKESESEAMANLNSVLKSTDITANKAPYSQGYGFSSSHVQIWELDHKEAERQRIDTF